ncbi:MAG: hypothetical protein Satyrvirus31_1, partial [Satyrvirus sp.]
MSFSREKICCTALFLVLVFSSVLYDVVTLLYCKYGNNSIQYCSFWYNWWTFLLMLETVVSGAIFFGMVIVCKNNDYERVIDT